MLDENPLWNYSDQELLRIKEKAGELFQLAQMLVWNACEIPGKPEEKSVYKNQLEELEKLLHECKIC
jgi:hypothetical protein